MLDVALIFLIFSRDMVPLVNPKAHGENRHDEQDNCSGRPDAALGALLATALSRWFEPADLVQRFFPWDAEPDIGLRRVWRGITTLGRSLRLLRRIHTYLTALLE